MVKLGSTADGKHKGCPELWDAIIATKPKYNFHGHLHSTNHEKELLGETKIYNVSILDEEYKLVYNPLIIRI